MERDGTPELGKKRKGKRDVPAIAIDMSDSMQATLASIVQSPNSVNAYIIEVISCAGQSIPFTESPISCTDISGYSRGSNVLACFSSLTLGSNSVSKFTLSVENYPKKIPT